MARKQIQTDDIANSAINNDKVNASAAIQESKLALSYPTHSNANDPSASEKAALAGTDGTPSGSNKFVTNSDPRLGGGSAGHTIQKDGVPFTARANLNFTGDAVTVTDDVGNSATVVHIPITGGGGGGGGGLLDFENFVFADDEWIISDDDPVTIETPDDLFNSLLINANGDILSNASGNLLVAS